MCDTFRGTDRHRLPQLGAEIGSLSAPTSPTSWTMMETYSIKEGGNRQPIWAERMYCPGIANDTEDEFWATWLYVQSLPPKAPHVLKEESN